MDILYKNFKYKNSNKKIVGRNYTPAIINFKLSKIMRKLNENDEKEFKEILNNGGCSFVRNGVMYNSMSLHHVEDDQDSFYILDTKSGFDYFYEKPIQTMKEMYLKYKNYGCSVVIYKREAK